jgi:hypothetical protein
MSRSLTQQLGDSQNLEFTHHNMRSDFQKEAQVRSNGRGPTRKPATRRYRES